MNNEGDALLFDLGNVVVKIDFERVISAWAVLARVPGEALAPLRRRVPLPARNASARRPDR